MHSLGGLLQTMDGYRREIAHLKEENKNLSHIKTLERWIYRYQVEFWSRIGLPFQIILFVFLGFLFGIRFSRGYRKIVVAMLF